MMNLQCRKHYIYLFIDIDTHYNDTITEFALSLHN